MTSMNASVFKARCLAVLDEVARTGERLTILKHGKPVAVLVPATGQDEATPQQSLAGTVEILGDIVRSPVSAGAWNAVRGKL